MQKSTSKSELARAKELLTQTEARVVELLHRAMRAEEGREEMRRKLADPVAQPSQVVDHHFGTFCPECGWTVGVDDDGLCSGCGATAVGSAVDAAVSELATLRADLETERGGNKALQSALATACKDLVEAEEYAKQWEGRKCEAEDRADAAEKRAEEAVRQINNILPIPPLATHGNLTQAIQGLKRILSTEKGGNE